MSSILHRGRQDEISERMNVSCPVSTLTFTFDLFLIIVAIFPQLFFIFFFVAETNYWTRLNLKFLDLQNDLVILIFRRIINHLKSEAFYHIFYTTWEIFL